ncbi:MAG TPA: ABC transporter ATP-binding protein [Caulobacteraceae bacterium]|nr:ABC transporter ATP-binding protein [Caulobacteraceae bacterium]
MSPLALHGVTARLGGRTALDTVSAVFEPGTITAVCGPNGAGKTTLLRAALGLIRPDAGDVRLSGRDPARIPPAERAALAGYLPQDRRLAWGIDALTVASLGAAAAAPDEAEARGREALGRVGLAGLEDRGVFEMSGGERARVLLARLLATRAPLLLVDEPAAGLDPEAQLLTLEILRDHARDGGTVVVTVHDLNLAARFCDRAVVLHQGRVVSEGEPVQALASNILRDVFNLDAAWIDTPDGPLLSARRLQVGGGGV